MPKISTKTTKNQQQWCFQQGTKRSCPPKVTPTSRDKSKKVSSLPVIICMYALYRDYVRLLTCYTYVDVCVLHSVYVYVAMFY